MFARITKNNVLVGKQSFSKRQLLVFAIAFALIGGYILLRSFAATVYYISPNGSDGNACTQSAPCQSMDRAYQVASPGDTVQMAGGDYTGFGTQRIGFKAGMQNLSPGCDPLGSWGAPSTTNCITFVPAPGANVTTASIEIHGSGVYLNGSASPGIAGPARTYNIKANGYVDFESDTLSQAGDHVTVTGVNTNSIGVFDVNHMIFKDVDVGGHYDSTGCGQIDPESGQSINAYESKISNRNGVTPSNIILDGLYLHDTNRLPAGAVSDCHDGGLFLVNADGLIIRNSVFSQNWVYNIQVQNFNSLPMPTNVTIENNWFGCDVEGLYVSPTSDTVCNGQASIQFDGSVSNWLIRYNSIGPGTSLSACVVAPCTYTNVREIGNVGDRTSSCEPMNYGYNAWTSSPCGAGDVTWNGSFASTAVGGEDFHLSNGTNNAVGLVTPTTADYTIGTDIDGNARSAPRTAGADVFGGSSGNAPTVTLSASPTSVNSGGSSTLAWSSTNATSCNATGAWSGSKATSGSQSTGALSSTSTYNLSCTGAGGGATASTTVTVTGGGGSDTTPPSVPTGLNVTGKTQTSISIAWQASTDNVGVAGYHLFNGATLVASTSNLNYTFTGLTCNTTYSNLGLQAYDAAGNTSDLAQAIVVPTTTSPCAAKPGDLNGDGRVDIFDLSILLSNYGASNSIADINKDGIVDIFDLSTLLSNYGT